MGLKTVLGRLKVCAPWASGRLTYYHAALAGPLCREIKIYLLENAASNYRLQHTLQTYDNVDVIRSIKFKLRQAESSGKRRET